MCYDLSYRKKDISLSSYNELHELNVLPPQANNRYRVNASDYPGMPLTLSHIHQMRKDGLIIFDQCVGQWGLIPYFIKDGVKATEIRSKYLHITKDQLLSDKIIRNIFPKQRCIIWANGLYYYHYYGYHKYPFYMYPADNGVFAMAGVWDEWWFNGTKHISFAMLVTDSKGHPIQKHFGRSPMNNKLPVMLKFKDIRKWLDIRSTYKDIEPLIKQMEIPYKAHTISHFSRMITNEKIYERKLYKELHNELFSFNDKGAVQPA